MKLSVSILFLILGMSLALADIDNEPNRECSANKDCEVVHVMCSNPKAFKRGAAEEYKKVMDKAGMLVMCDSLKTPDISLKPVALCTKGLCSVRMIKRKLDRSKRTKPSVR